jgi:(p)ppGpp synthase/HD superfamily hydrolase
MNKYEQAVTLALLAHKGQVRKTNQTPYIVHPLTVAYLVSQYTKDEEIIVAAVLHDTLEDTTVNEEQLEELFGQRVLDLVLSVTEDKNLDWADRKRLYVETVSEANEDVWLISIADKVHNASNLYNELTQKGNQVWESFNKGKTEKMWFENFLYDSLRSKWTHPLLNKYRDLIDSIERF